MHVYVNMSVNIHIDKWIYICIQYRHIYADVCIYAYTQIGIFKHTGTYIHVCINIYIICMYIHMYTYIRTYTYVHAHRYQMQIAQGCFSLTHTCTDIRVCMSICMHIHTHMYINIHTHMYMLYPRRYQKPSANCEELFQSRSYMHKYTRLI